VIADYHMHLVDDDHPYTDADFTTERVAAYVAAAATAGVDEICFTDHVHRFRQARDWFDHPLWVADAVEDLTRYHATVTAARDAGLPVRVGLEVEYLEGSEERIRQTLDGYAWDMLLGSVHWVSGLAVDWDAAPVWEMHAVADVWRMYVDAVCAAAASGIYDVMAHPDLAKVFGHRPEPKPFALYEQMADAFQAAGVCAEVSTAGYRRPLGEIYPDPDLLRMFRARGVPVTLASDAHSPGGVGLRFGDAVSVLTAAGYRTITLFRSREPRQEPLG
jgi:histidinol-phosphatase (PHP family)